VKVRRRITAFPAPDGIAVNFPAAMGNDIENNHRVGKIESRVTGIERLQKTVFHVKFLPQILTAFDGAIPAVLDILRPAAGKAKMFILFMLNGFD